MLTWGFQIPLRISSLYLDIFQTPNRMTLTIEKHFGTWLFSYITLFSSHLSENRSPSTFPNRLLDTSRSTVQIRLTVLESKPTHCFISWFLALGDTFVFAGLFFLACLNISKRIMSQLPTFWYNTEAFWVGKCIIVLHFSVSHPLRLSCMANETGTKALLSNAILLLVSTVIDTCLGP